MCAIHHRPTIQITAVVEGKEIEIETYANEYPNLMSLIYDRVYPHNFGDCKGIGRCGTCHIRILNPEVELAGMERNERSTLGKIESSGNNSRLACQILITPAINGLKLEVLNDDELGLY